MPNSFREIRRRIKGITNTKQITKTMEMVSASKMRKAQAATAKTRAYAEKAMEILVSLGSHAGTVRHPLFAKREVKHTTVILVSSDRGLCGGFNMNLLNKALGVIKPLPPEAFSLITVGKKGRDMLLRLGYTLKADFSGIKKTEYREVLPLVKMILDEYIEEKTDRVVIVYTHFVNTIKQKPIVKTILPLSRRNLMEVAKELLGREIMDRDHKFFEYKIEPVPEVVLQMLIPRFSEMQIFQSILEGEASEHSARMVAMKNATDAATDLIEDLVLTGNDIRQSSITAEIAEIVTAGEAMKDK